MPAMFVQPLSLVLGSQILLVAATESFPTIDIEKTCRASEMTIVEIFGSGTGITFDTCMKQESAARGQIAKDWPNFPAEGRQRCMNPRAYMPSYVEWLTCLEMERDVRNLRENARPTSR
jgi:predicted lipoprotein with Yx(FWY)xxD motif